MPLKLGQPLPEISLKQKTDAGLVDVSLRRNVGKGKTVILFVPLAFTGVCTDELCKVTGLLDEYKKLGADVIAISVDSPSRRKPGPNRPASTSPSSPTSTASPSRPSRSRIPA